MTQNDFHGVNYFGVYALKLSKRGRLASEGPQSFIDTDAVTSPEHFVQALLRFYRKFKKPILITENGIATVDDRKRMLFLMTYLLGIHKAIQSGIPIDGYLYWSLTDNFEWFEPLGKSRFGLVEVDFETMKRTPRKSYYLYKEVCNSTFINFPMLVGKYLKDRV